MSDADKIAELIPGHAMRFIRSDGEPREDAVLIERLDLTDDEIELAFTLQRDRYYLRMRRDDVKRLLAEEPQS